MWRSLLFVPTLNNRLIDSASRCDADVVVLDLEAAVASERKDEARDQLPNLIPRLKDADATVAVRINLLDRGGLADLAAAQAAGANLVVLPKATPASTAQTAGGVGLPIIPLIEDPLGVIDALTIAEASSAVVGLGFGVEDYAAEMGAPPTPELLVPAAFQVIQAARAAQREALVIPDTIADYRDLRRFEFAARKARAMGASGSFAIHPAQIEVLNNIFTPTSAEREAAVSIIQAAEHARQSGQSVAKLNGQMIDAPVEARARALLARAAQQRRK